MSVFYFVMMNKLVLTGELKHILFYWWKDCRVCMVVMLRTVAMVLVRLGSWGKLGT